MRPARHADPPGRLELACIDVRRSEEGRLVAETRELPNETTVWSLDETRAEPVRRVADFLPAGVRQI